MKHDQLTKQYKAFFEDSEAGKYFVAELNRLISDAHRDAENVPENSRDHAQRAKGVRVVLDHIKSVGVEVKKKGGQKQE